MQLQSLVNQQLGDTIESVPRIAGAPRRAAGSTCEPNTPRAAAAPCFRAASAATQLAACVRTPRVISPL